MPTQTSSKISQKQTDPASSKAKQKGPRKVKIPAYRSFRLQKKITHTDGPQLPGAFSLLKNALLLVIRNWKVMLGVSLVYGVLNFVFVHGFALGGNLATAKDNLDVLFSEGGDQIAGGAALFAYLMGSSSGNAATPGAEGYQLIFTLMVSLALIWVLREIFAGNTKLRIRDAYYRGIGPLVPFTLVLCVVGLQLIPFAAGVGIYSSVAAVGTASTGIEALLWATVMVLLSLASFYMISSSLFALYIVTLPDMTPMKALRSASQLVRGRRSLVVRKVFFLPLALIIMGMVLMMPILLLVTVIAPWVFFLLVTFSVAVVHSYMYSLYRSLI